MRSLLIMAPLLLFYCKRYVNKDGYCFLFQFFFFFSHSLYIQYTTKRLPQRKKKASYNNETKFTPSYACKNTPITKIQLSRRDPSYIYLLLLASNKIIKNKTVKHYINYVIFNNGPRVFAIKSFVKLLARSSLVELMFYC